MNNDIFILSFMTKVLLLNLIGLIITILIDKRIEKRKQKEEGE